MLCDLPPSHFADGPSCHVATAKCTATRPCSMCRPCRPASYVVLGPFICTAPPHRRQSCNTRKPALLLSTRFQARRAFPPTYDQLILSTKLCLYKMKREQSDIDAHHSNGISCEEPSCTVNDLLSILLQRAIEISDGKGSPASPSRPTGWISPRSRRSTNVGAFGVASLAQALRSFHGEQEGRRAMRDATGR